MTVPTVGTVSPNTGRTGGRYLVGVVGTGFRLPAAPPLTGPAPVPPPSVRVWFIDTEGVATEAERVDVLSTTQVYALAPSHDAGVVSLRLDNVDANGATVAGESVTVPSAFTFKRPMLSGEARSAERILARVVRTFRKLLVREVIDEVSITIHTDFDALPEDGTSVIELAKMPSLLLVGPGMETNRFYSSNVKRTVDLEDGGFAELRPSRTVDLSFTLLGVSEFTQELLNFAQETTAFFERNPWLYVDRDPADPSKGRVRYELAMTTVPGTASQPNESNVRQFSGACVIRGVDLDDSSMVVRVTRSVSEALLNPQDAVSGTGAGGDVLGGDGTTNALTGGPTQWPVSFDPAIYQLALSEEE